MASQKGRRGGKLSAAAASKMPTVLACLAVCCQQILQTETVFTQGKRAFPLKRCRRPGAARLRRSPSRIARSAEGQKHREQFSFGRRGVATSAAAAAAALLAARRGRRLGSEAAQAAVLEAADKVEKSPLDPNVYQALTLRNGLRVLLVSDPEADRAAAALDVHVGYFSDPEDLPGLAHFCEHMLFLGTELFPEENSFDKFLTANGGFSNAFTESEDTCFFFACGNKALPDALERFGAFFQKPLLTASAAEREVNAINSEHLKNLQNDSFRFAQVLSNRANPASPFHHFGTGTVATLLESTSRQGIDLRSALLTFYRRYYHAPLMTLCITGSQPLDVLGKYAKQYFEGVPGLDAADTALHPSSAWAGTAPFLPEAYANIVEVVPVQEVRGLQVAFPIPFAPAAGAVKASEAPPIPAAGSMTLESWRFYNPSSHLGSVLGHEGSSSLCSLLRRKGWITELEVGATLENSSFALLVVSMELTEEGLRCQEDVMELLFGHINQLRNLASWPEDLLNEDLQLSEAAWRTMEQVRPSDVAVSLAQSMQNWALPKYYISGNFRLRGGPGLAGTVSSLMARLTPDNALVTIASRSFEGKTDETEPWYGTKFRCRSLAAQKRRWETAKPAPGLGLPALNPFLPRSLELKAPREKAPEKGKVPPAPVASRRDQRWRSFFRQDTSFGVPKAYAFVDLMTSYPRRNARTTVCSRLYEELFGSALKETLLYNAQVAGLVFGVSTSTRGVQLFFGGYDDRLSDFARAAIDALVSFDPTAEPTRFDAQRDVFLRELESFSFRPPNEQAAYWKGLATMSPEFSVQELRTALLGIRAEDLAEFARQLWRSERLFGVTLCQGNLRQAEADQLVAAVEGSLAFEPLPETEWPAPSVAQIPVLTAGPGCVLLHDAMDSKEENSAVEVTFQAGCTRSNREAETKKWAAVQVLSSALSDSFYSEIRTKQQLGYIVGSSPFRSEGVYGIVFLVQGTVLGPVQVLERIDAFLEGARKALAAKTEAEFQTLAASLADSRLTRPKQLLGAASRNWSEIQSREFQWSRVVNEASALQRVTGPEVMQAFDRWLAPGGPERRRMVSLVFGASHRSQRPAAESGLTAAGAQIISDPQAFARSQPQWPRSS